MQEERVYKPLITPEVKWEGSSDGDTGILTVAPLESGFGTTIGNALRRVLLSAVEGAAVTSVIIKGVNNEFSRVDGVKEDTIALVLRLKKLIIKNTTGKPGKMQGVLKGPGEFKAALFKGDPHLEILNKDLKIGTVADDGELDITIFVENGRGYQEAKWPIGKQLQSDDRIYVDAMFSPIERVSFRVDKFRVGGKIDYDKLVMEIETDGTTRPKDALDYAISVLKSQLSVLLTGTEIKFDGGEEKKKENTAAGEGLISGVPVEVFLKPIDELELSVRANNCLVSAGVRRVLDLVNMKEDDLLRIKNFGKKSLDEVKEVLGKFGLHLGMNVREVDLKKALRDESGSK